MSGTWLAVAVISFGGGSERSVVVRDSAQTVYATTETVRIQSTLTPDQLRRVLQPAKATLRCIQFYKAKFSDAEYDILRSFPKLKRLSLSRVVNEMSSKRLVTGAPLKLDSLSVSGSRFIDSPMAFANLHPSLKVLSIDTKQAVRLKGATVLTHLTTLTLSGRGELKELGGISRLVSLKQLTVGNAHRLRGLRDISVAPKLQTLTISNPGRSEDIAILRRSQSLRRLLIFGALYPDDEFDRLLNQLVGVHVTKID